MASSGDHSLHSVLTRTWVQRGLLAYLLWPLSRVYAALFDVRRLTYRWGWRASERVPAVVVVVGNVVAGGAGKTPTVIALVNHLRNQHFKVGIISRGYGRAGSDCQEVQAHSSAQVVGDEPKLLHQLTGVPVFVAKRRIDAARALLAKHRGTQIIVCDDGLQHYGLYRDIEVCVFDDRGCGNRWLVPAGPLREDWPRHSPGHKVCRTSDLLVLHTGSQPAFGGYRAQRSLSAHVSQSDGVQLALHSLQFPGSKPIVALAGIAQPDAFFSMLRQQGLVLSRTIALPDHFAFESLPGGCSSEQTLLCTEKDALKLWPIAPSALAVPMQLQIEPDFFHQLDARISNIMDAKLAP